MTARAEQLGFDYENDKEFAARMLPRLIPIARELATARPDRRLTVADLRHEAVKRGVLTGAEKGKRLSFIHEVFPSAGFEPTAEFRRSDIPRSHRNLHRVHFYPSPDPRP